MRRLPLPWSVVDNDHYYTLTDANGANLANIPYARTGVSGMSRDTVLTKEEALVVARQFVKWAEGAAPRR